MRIPAAEDDRKLGALLCRGLREEQYAVDLCSSGQEALEHAQSNAYDAVVLDVMLPGTDGFEACRRLRACNVLVPILMLTARDSLRDKVTGLSEGADDYLTKPFSFEELLASIRALLRRSQDYKVRNLGAGDLELDPVRRRVTRGGKKVSLTGKEYTGKRRTCRGRR